MMTRASTVGLDGLHPCDLERLRRLGELLFDVAAGRMVTRAPLIPLTACLMVNLRADCSADEVEATVERLLSIADDWLGVEALMEAAAAVIVDAPLPPPPSWAEGLRRAFVGRLEASQ